MTVLFDNRLFGSGGGKDTHNKGWFATPEALRTAHPTANAGDFAVVGSTDTIWVWDVEGSAWKDTDTKGQVTSVNNETGDVKIKTVNGNSLMGTGNVTVKTYQDFPASFTTSGTLEQVVASMMEAEGYNEAGMAYLGGISGACMPWPGGGNAECKVEYYETGMPVLTLCSSNVPPYRWEYHSYNNDYKWKKALAQMEVMPTDNLDLAVGIIVQYIGTTNATYTNGYLYKCVQNGSDYSWQRCDVQPASTRNLVTDLASTSVTINELQGNTDYQYGTLTSLTISNSTDSYLETNIYFTSGETIDVLFPDEVTLPSVLAFEPNKIYTLTIKNNILTVNYTNPDIEVENLLEGATIENGIYTKSTISTSGDFVSAKIEVTPGEELYTNRQYGGTVSVAQFDENGTFLRTYKPTTDSNGKFTVPNSADIKYLSLPINAAVARSFTISREYILNKGDVRQPMFTGEIASAETFTTYSNDNDLKPKTYSSFKNTNPKGTPYKWTAVYIENATDTILTVTRGYVLIGLDSQKRALGFDPANGKLYVIYSTSEYTDFGVMSQLILPRDPRALGSSYQYNIKPWRTKVDNNGIKFYDVDTEELLNEVTYAQIDAQLNGQYVSSDFNKVLGVLYNKGTSSYPTNSYFVAFKSTKPVVSSGSTPTDEVTVWKDKQWYCYGTSMTEYATGYVNKLAALSGMVVHNYGKGGSGIIPSLHPADNIKTRCMRTTDGKADADLLTLEIIPNDMGGSLGTPTDTGDDTFLGNLNQIIQYLFENCPKAQIVIMTATRARYKASDSSIQYPPESEYMDQRIEWEDGVKEVCRRNCVQYWDGAGECGLGYHRAKSSTSGNTYVKDQIHLTNVGSINLAEYLFNKLKALPLWHTTY